MGKMQREKGKRGEREVVAILQKLGWPQARRARQSDGAVDPDVAGCDPLWIEVKRRKQIAACRFMDQAEGDASAKKIPTTFMREDGGEWYVMCKSDDLLRLSEVIVAQYAEQTKHPKTCPEACDLPKRD